jgi:hypothetical protein
VLPCAVQRLNLFPDCRLFDVADCRREPASLPGRSLAFLSSTPAACTRSLFPHDHQKGDSARRRVSHGLVLIFEVFRDAS